MSEKTVSEKIDSEEKALAKINRINLLLDFYEQLLTEKQRTFLTCYFDDDFSLGEIAAEFSISRQAVYEHIKRAELMLEEYEQKLQLLVKHEQKTEFIQEIKRQLRSNGINDQHELHTLLEKLIALD